MSDEVVDLIQKMVKADPESRIILTEIKEHEWIRDLYPKNIEVKAVAPKLPQQSAQMTELVERACSFIYS